ncbi:hypothetical protein ACH5RR_025462 [Cinchona calisaya]|uniref:MULE transposase domain-containing protein n=1 Tax=Cinchona calisaya TaxID=153742 RepID=A0ABD2Z327_9GENT
MNGNKFFLSKDQGYRAKRLALSMIHGSKEDQYNKISDYIHEIKRSNPGTTVVLKLVDGPLFGLDGTFRKGPSGWMLLTVVGIDHNNGFFPIAYVACEGQNKDSWAWFLNLLKEDLMIERDYEWTLMSDKQKGIIQACEAVFSNADHRIQDKVEIDLDAAKWLDEKSPNEGTRAHFRTLPKCDMLFNNICESFNSKILDARKEFIVSMMEFFRKYITNRKQENRNRENARLKTNRFCPKFKKRMKKYIEHATTMIPQKANDTLYEVACPYAEELEISKEKALRRHLLMGKLKEPQGMCCSCLQSSQKKNGIDEKSSIVFAHNLVVPHWLHYITLQVNKRIKISKGEGTQEGPNQRDAQGAQEACVVAIPNSRKGKKARISKGKGKEVFDAFKRLYDALEILTCFTSAKEPDLYQVFSIEQSIPTHTSQPSKGKRNSRVKKA